MPVRSPASEMSASTPQQEISRIAELRAVHQAFRYLHLQEMEFRRWQMELARIPAPPFGESTRTEWLRQRFLELGLHNVEVDDLGNVFGLFCQGRQGPLL